MTTKKKKSCTCSVGSCALRAGRQPDGECAMDRTVHAMEQARSAPKRRSVTKPEALLAYLAVMTALGAEDIDSDALGRIADMTMDVPDILAATSAMRTHATVSWQTQPVPADRLVQAATKALTQRAEARKHGGTA